MKNIAVILAGGVGSRVGANVPKQFIDVFGRPVLAYTIEKFQNHPLIDEIEVVCRPSYVGELQAIIEREGFDKVKWIALGGETFQDSVINGINHLKGKIDDDDQILIHYGASPMVPDYVITDAVNVCTKHGNASPANSLVYLAAHKSDSQYSDTWVDRDEVMCLNSPQALKFGYACWLYDEGERKGILKTVEPHTTSLMFALGERIYFSKNSTANIKITTPDDLDIFKGYVLLSKYKSE